MTKTRPKTKVLILRLPVEIHLDLQEQAATQRRATANLGASDIIEAVLRRKTLALTSLEERK